VGFDAHRGVPLRAAGRDQLEHPLPFVPGLEAAGVVVEAGEGARKRAGSASA
jgi:NADPH:quinone reductase-like Zn-dependent oxidoreductase